ncbi:hypothetical protein AG1IA_07697 [Rhizoctonia solani AG-1 IA]|uniref:Uncharacterized protein n=1 Tax=Thanatephorus cucumeris (strain AG1-IA) TaxID=983506 RepID=L8WJB1_THACA|nr:hypothetical protein AG1IA_07697 [Rhizoctonia solani AG-1 IA]
MLPNMVARMSTVYAHGKRWTPRGPLGPTAVRLKLKKIGECHKVRQYLDLRRCSFEQHLYEIPRTVQILQMPDFLVISLVVFIKISIQSLQSNSNMGYLNRIQQPQPTMKREHNKAIWGRRSGAEISPYDLGGSGCRCVSTERSLVASVPSPTTTGVSCSLSPTWLVGNVGNARDTLSRLISIHGFQSLITAFGSTTGRSFVPGCESRIYTETGSTRVLPTSLLTTKLRVALMVSPGGSVHRNRSESPTRCINFTACTLVP